MVQEGHHHHLPRKHHQLPMEDITLVVVMVLLLTISAQIVAVPSMEVIIHLPTMGMGMSTTMDDPP
jgi:hypothetical protein